MKMTTEFWLNLINGGIKLIMFVFYASVLIMAVILLQPTLEQLPILFRIGFTMGAVIVLMRKTYREFNARGLHK